MRHSCFLSRPGATARRTVTKTWSPQFPSGICRSTTATVPRHARIGRERDASGLDVAVRFSPCFRADDLGVDSLSILVNHRSFQLTSCFPRALGGFLERRIPGKNGELLLEMSFSATRHTRPESLTCMYSHFGESRPEMHVHPSPPGKPLLFPSSGLPP